MIIYINQLNLVTQYKTFVNSEYQQMQSQLKKQKSTEFLFHDKIRDSDLLNNHQPQTIKIQSPSKESFDQQFKTPASFNLQMAPVFKTEDKIKALLGENKKLRIANKQLKQQLQTFEKRLDETLKKRTVSQKKPRVSQEVVESMELKNAYKQCQIYKRQISNLKKKQQFLSQDKLKQMTNQINQFQQQRARYVDEIKNLKKINRQQNKALNQLTGSNFSKVIQQIQKLKEQNKKLNSKVSKQEREDKLSKMAVNNQKRKRKQQQIKGFQTKKIQQQKQASQIQILKLKTDKDSKQLAILTSQINKLKFVNEQLKNQINQKNKQIQCLRQRLKVFRKEVRLNKSRLQTQPSRNQKSQINIAHRTLKKDESRVHTKRRSQFAQKPINSQSQSQDVKKLLGKYPRLVEAGEKKQGTYKWNHHQFSSKIKQIQVSPHINGHIKQVNFRYEKGEPNPSTKTQFAKFCCQENNGQFIRSIKGGFKQGLLRYLTVQTNTGRISHFGQHETSVQCISFTFGDGEGQYPGAFFGQSSDEGINRIGCLIECEK